MQPKNPLLRKAGARADIVGFINVRDRFDPPEPKLLEKGLRLITTEGYPPFNDRDKDGAPRGYHVELARLLCEELNIACTLKFVPFEQIPSLLKEGKADAALAGLAIHPALLADIGFSIAYLQRPARFVRLADHPLAISPRDLEDQPVAVLGGTAHEAFLKAYFPGAKRIAVADLDDARTLLLDRKVVALFADAFQTAPLLALPDSPVVYAGNPYYDSHFFGDGMAIALQRKQAGLKNMMDYGLLKLAQKGRLAELYARHFPVDVYGDN